ncbi:hypothetical protein GCM10028807_23730 [Spirosoma daeguense]
MPLFTVREVVSGLRNAQDVEAITEYLYHEYFQTIRNMVRKYKGNEQDSQDLFQDVLIIFIEIVARDKFDPEGNASLATFLYGIAYRLWRKRKQRAENRLKWEQDFVTTTYEVEDSVRQYENQLTANQLLTRIGEPCRSLLEAYYLDGLSLDEIASQYQLPEPTIRQRKFRCLQKLRILL